MTPSADRSIHRRRAALRAGLLAAASIVVTPAAIGAAQTPETVARDTLLAALAPALAVRGATADVTIAAPDGRRALEACARMEGFVPAGARLAGRTVVGVRCVDGAAWQVHLAATVRVEAPGWQATRALRGGDPIGAGDVALAMVALTPADLEAAATLARAGSAGTPRSAVASRGLASIDGRLPAPIGRVALRAVAAGRPLMQADLRDEGRINPGDAVRVVYLGDGFAVASEGHSVGIADPGSNVTIRLASGVVVNGTLRADRTVELPR